MKSCVVVVEAATAPCSQGSREEEHNVDAVEERGDDRSCIANACNQYYGETSSNILSNKGFPSANAT